MNRTLVWSLLVGACAIGCAHEDKVTKAATPSAPETMQAKVPARTAPAPAPVPDLSKTKEDDAIFFDFDSSLVRDDARPVLQRVGSDVKSKSVSVKIEGNCDEVGTVEYNLALGEARARSAKDYLVHLGVPSSRIAIASYGSQRPKYPGHDETSHAKNRRDDLIVH